MMRLAPQHICFLAEFVQLCLLGTAHGFTSLPVGEFDSFVYCLVLTFRSPQVLASHPELHSLLGTKHGFTPLLIGELTSLGALVGRAYAAPQVQQLLSAEARAASQYVVVEVDPGTRLPGLSIK